MKKYLKILLLLVMVVSVLCTSVSALTYSSEYIMSKMAYISQGDPGKLTVHFHVTGMDMMDTIGAKTITIFELGGSTPSPATDHIVKVFQSETTPGMTVSGTFSYSGTVSFSAEAGVSYYALILFYAAKDGGSDSMPYITSAYKAS